MRAVVPTSEIGWLPKLWPWRRTMVGGWVPIHKLPWRSTVSESTRLRPASPTSSGMRFIAGPSEVERVKLHAGAAGVDLAVAGGQHQARQGLARRPPESRARPPKKRRPSSMPTAPSSSVPHHRMPFDSISERTAPTSKPPSLPSKISPPRVWRSRPTPSPVPTQIRPGSSREGSKT